MGSIFQRLISYSPREARVPYEDYVTELMCGVIEATPGLKDEFIKYIIDRLEVDETNRPKSIDGWHIKTQYWINSKRRPDIAILDRSNNLKLLIEHKIDSKPEREQLEDYIAHVSKVNAIGLVLLTKYYVQNSKDVEKVPTVWWYDLFDFFEDYQRNAIPCCREHWLVDEFVQFLKEARMKEPRCFEPSDIAQMSRLPAVISVMDRTLDKVGDERLFGELIPEVKRDSTRSTQLRAHGRYVLYGALRGTSQILTVFVGFLFDEGHIKFIRDATDGSKDCNSPIAFVSVEGDPRKGDPEDSVTKLRGFGTDNHGQMWRFIETGSTEYWTRLIAFETIVDITKTSSGEVPNHVDVLGKWFKDRIAELCKLKESLQSAK